MKIDWSKVFWIFYQYVKPYLTKAFAKQLAKSVLFKVFAFSGIQGFLYTRFAAYFVRLGLLEINALLIHWGVKIESKEQGQKYESIINDPKSSAEDIANAGHDLLNN